MKISNSIREAYRQQKELNDRLSIRVKELFEQKKENWFYKGRIKGVESFTQKIETGHFKNVNALEDFFACTLVVENRTAIQEAKRFVMEHCDIQYQKPKNDKITHNQPYEFQFDDLRLYVKLKPTNAGPPGPLNEIIFEVQIKTFLQHAWTLATHELVYKGDTINWGMQRIAYQIKAMLEHAEVAIEQAEEMGMSSALARSHQSTDAKSAMVSWLKETWPADQLPADTLRLANTILEILSAFKLDLESLKESVRLEALQGLGPYSLNLSPYETIIKALHSHNNTAFQAFLKQPLTSRNRTQLLIIPEMELTITIQSERIIYLRGEPRIH